ncbi:MFS transporter [Staphylospora marina]|uniref:MFS transporter n=1 Tax=Staphylospora marina TaxID=2490858 RepID=UPI000F5C0921|nr:MFS transporter [Staphylospora marina]
MAPSKRFRLETYMIAVILGTLDVAILTPGLGPIMEEHGLAIHWAVWAISLPLLFFSMALPVFEGWADQYGRTRVFVVSLILFAAGTLVAALSGEWVWLVWGRVVQATGAGGLVPLVALRVKRLFVLRHASGRLRAYALFMFGAAAFPFLSTALVHLLGWRGLFLLHLFLALRMMLRAGKWLGSDRPRKSGVTGGESVFFFGLSVLFLMTAVTGTDLLGGWSAFLKPEVLPLWIMGIGMVIPLWMVEQRGERTLFAEHLFSARRLWLFHLQAALAGFVWMALVLVPGWVSRLYGLPDYWNGLLLGCILFCSAVSVPGVMRISKRWSFRTVTSWGFLLSSAAYFALALTNGNPWLFVALGILGGSLSFTLTAPVHKVLFDLLPHRRIRGTLTVLGMFRTAGGALGLIVMARLFSSLSPELDHWFSLPVGSLIQTAQENVFVLCGFFSLVGWLISQAIPGTACDPSPKGISRRKAME